MTQRLYYTDSLLCEFDSTVVACDEREGRFEVRLDRTAFYPTSGGQPFDAGTIGGATVIDVVDRAPAGIVHVVDRALAPGSRVTSRIDWPRRLDHMQQHTGQHILSAAFDRRSAVRTVSFHLGRDVSTIDLAREVTPGEIAEAEADANRVVWEDREVTVRFAAADEAAALPLRKESTRVGELRLVEIRDFDLSACGGTHVPRTGMVGMIAVSSWERFKGGSRIAFVCGGRALASHTRLRDTLTAAARLAGAAPADVPSAIERMQAELKETRKTIRDLEDTLTRFRAAELRAGAETIGGYRAVLTVQPALDGGALKRLAAEIVQAPGLVAILAGTGQPVPVVVARSEDVPFDAGAWLERAIAALGGRGGGRPEQAQGGIAAGGEEIVTFARETLKGPGAFVSGEQ